MRAKCWVVIFLAATYSVCVAGDACNLLTWTFLPNVQTYATVGKPINYLACYHQVPFNLTVAIQTLNILKDVAQLYGLTEISCYPPPGYNFTTCLPTGIDQIEQRVNSGYYTNDYEFHYDVADLFSGLKDFHTLYSPPAGYSSSCYISRVWNVVIDREGGFSFQPDSTSPYVDYANFQINLINKARPWDWIRTRALSGKFKDLGVGINEALHTIKFENIPVTNMAKFLQSDSLQLQQNGNFVNLNIPVTVQCMMDETSLQKVLDLNRPFFLQENLRKISKSNPTSNPTTPSSSKPKTNVQKNPPSSPIVMPPQYGSPSDLELISSTSLGTLSVYRYKNVPVWKLTTFSDPANDATDFLNVVNTGLETSMNLHDKTLILDLSQSGFYGVESGGAWDMCLAEHLMKLLVQEWTGIHDNPVFALSDMKKNEFNDVWVNQIPGLYGKYRDPNSGSLYNASVWYNRTTVFKSFGNDTNVPFTQKAYWPGDCDIMFPGPPAPYYFQQILIVTDGVCGNACGFFASKLASYGKAQVLTYGGYQDEDVVPDIAAAVGATGRGYLDVYELANKTTKPLVPMPTSAYVTWSDEIVYFDGEIPREFMKMEADFHSYLYSPLTGIRVLINDPVSEQAISDLYETALFTLGISAGNSIVSFSFLVIGAFFLLIL